MKRKTSYVVPRHLVARWKKDAETWKTVQELVELGTI
ncbi:hypothetical protein LCGC14_1448260 [marine sediment metagenome]|uniref:Uncharacterized protein n=1 Tax=marine sediment metagenome TaxID=412755 RepID=A0A0F9JIK1_9ZZZZ